MRSGEHRRLKVSVKMWDLTTTVPATLSVGLDRIDDLIEDLEQALERL